MATDAGGTRPLTQFVAGNGQSSVSYQLPAGLAQYVQSVVATVDTSASGEVSPLLTIRDDADIVIADKEQTDVLEAGGLGRATWALRLTDDNVNSRATVVKYAGYAVFSDNAGEMMQYVTYTMGNDPTPGDDWDLQAGVPLLDLTTTGGPSVLRDGIYTWTIHPRFVRGAFQGAPNPYPPPNAWAGYSAWFELQLSTIPGPLFADISVVLGLAAFAGADNVPQPSSVYPQTTTACRLPMHAGDQFILPTVVHNIPDADPYHAARRGADMEIQLLWEPLRKPFPVI
jgi:hypothetical protein